MTPRAPCHTLAMAVVPIEEPTKRTFTTEEARAVPTALAIDFEAAHLTEFPDYYTRLAVLADEAAAHKDPRS